MPVMPVIAAWLAAAGCALLMGFAIQRGATCTVAAVDELLQSRSARRLLALLEASLWVCGGLLIGQRVLGLQHLPMAHALGSRTVVGAVLLGLGAFVNRACVFGAIARLGAGEWTQAAAPLGFFLGCLVVTQGFMPTSLPEPGSSGSPGLLASLPDAVAWLAAAAFGLRIGVPLWRHRGNLKELVARRLWSPHAATIVIGITFLAMLLLVGAWAYTDVLAELASRMSGAAGSVTLRTLLLACLLLGAIQGGRGAPRPAARRIDAMAALRSLVGGAMMGTGSLLIPGGNDGLILIGLPMLWPHAWVAFAIMCLTIAGAQTLQRRFAGRPAAATQLPR